MYNNSYICMSTAMDLLCVSSHLGPLDGGRAGGLLPLDLVDLVGRQRQPPVHLRWHLVGGGGQSCNGTTPKNVPVIQRFHCYSIHRVAG